MIRIYPHDHGAAQRNITGPQLASQLSVYLEHDLLDDTSELLGLSQGPAADNLVDRFTDSILQASQFGGV